MNTEWLKDGEDAELLVFLDRAFGFEDGAFQKLLPKLYRREYAPAAHNLGIRREGIFRAAVGIYPVSLSVAGENLSALAVGNVAVDAECRGQGMMTRLMLDTVSYACQTGADFAFLGGNRQRYARFGFEPAGFHYVFRITPQNVASVAEESHAMVVAREIRREDTELLREADRLYRSRTYHTERDLGRLYDTLCSWSFRPFALLEDGHFLGYYLREGKNVTELMLNEPAQFEAAVAAMVTTGEIELRIPAFETVLPAQAEQIAEECGIEQTEKFLVLNFRRTVGAFLRLRAHGRRLGDGRLTVRVGTDGGGECFTVAVKDGTVEVVPSEKPPDIRLTYSQAMRFFFSLFSAERSQLAPAVQDWFPLCLSVRLADHA